MRLDGDFTLQEHISCIFDDSIKRYIANNKMSKDSIKVVFGTAGALFNDDNAPEIYKALEAGGCGVLDTAQLYSGKEEVIGRTGGAKRFVIDTKEIGGFQAKSATKDTVIQRGEESIKKLGTFQVCPDSDSRKRR